MIDMAGCTLMLRNLALVVEAVVISSWWLALCGHGFKYVVGPVTLWLWFWLHQCLALCGWCYQYLVGTVVVTWVVCVVALVVAVVVTGCSGNG